MLHIRCFIALFTSDAPRRPYQANSNQRLVSHECSKYNIISQEHETRVRNELGLCALSHYSMSFRAGLFMRTESSSGMEDAGKINWGSSSMTHKALVWGINRLNTSAQPHFNHWWIGWTARHILSKHYPSINARGVIKRVECIPTRSLERSSSIPLSTCYMYI